MEKIVLLTKEASLRTELSVLLPKGFGLVTDLSSREGSFIFLDLDSIKNSVIKELSDDNFVVAVTKRRWTEPAMEAVTSGAYEVLHRPLDREIVRRLLLELSALRDETNDHITLAGLPPIPTCVIVGRSAIIMDVCKKLARLSQVDTPVLITGETGTGKELIAETIAQLSSRFGKPFAIVNCAALPENLLESELFGYEKGAFTGAAAAKEGILKIADGGCVFFDEVGELPFSLQGKLLRFIQAQTFYPLGGTREVHVDVRVLSATNRDLLGMVRAGKFREDLYHRLKVTSIHIPPLRQRMKDLLPLVSFFVRKYKHTAPRQIKGFSKAFMKKLADYDWPGNIRELENTIRSALALSKTHFLTTNELKEFGLTTSAPPQTEIAQSIASAIIAYVRDAIVKNESNIYDKVHQEIDKPLFSYVLSHTRENQSEAARLLGINRLTLRKKIG